MPTLHIIIPDSTWHKCPAAAQGVFQVIDTGSGAVDNLVEFKFASAVRGSLNVAGTVAPAEVKLLLFRNSAAETQAQSKHVECLLQLRC